MTERGPLAGPPQVPRFRPVTGDSTQQC